MSQWRRLRFVAFCLLSSVSSLLSFVLMVSCSDEGGSPIAPSGGGGQTTSTTITITASGANPRTVTVPVGSRVRFVNSDTRNHEMSSDPHPEHSDCPEINAVGFLRPGESRETENLVTPRTCGFHDHLNDQNQSLRGQIGVTP